MVFWQEPPTTNWAQNARGLHHFSLEVLVYFLSFFHHFLWPCSAEGLRKPVMEFLANPLAFLFMGGQ